jgi:hypothetical protein
LGSTQAIGAIDLIDDFAAVVLVEGELFSAQAVQLAVSADGGQMFWASQSLDSLLSPPPDSETQDLAVPSVAIADDQRVHLVWSQREDSGYSVQYSHGDRIEPCGVRGQ